VPPLTWSTAFVLRPEPPIVISRAQAQQEARRELSKPVYHQHDPSPVERAATWVIQHVLDLLHRAARVAPHGNAGLLVLLGLVLLVVVAVWYRLGPPARSRRQHSAARPFDHVRTPDEHRRAADRYAADQEWAEAVRERLRAIISDLQRRALLEPRAGLTANEAAQEAGKALPGRVAELRQAAAVFDAIWYGGRPAGPEDYELLRTVDATIAETRPRLPATAGSPTG
jgi:hypothetical protein